MKDLTLGDLGWIFGSMMVFAFSCILIRLAYDHRHVLKAVWRQARESGLVRVNIVRDFEGDGEEDDQFEHAPNHYETSPNRPASPDAQQLELTHFDTNKLIFELTKRPLEREQVLTVMARAKRTDGTDWMSANKISSAIGGTNADNMAIISALRPKKEAPAEPPRGSPLYRPKNGW